MHTAERLDTRDADRTEILRCRWDSMDNSRCMYVIVH